MWITSVAFLPLGTFPHRDIIENLKARPEPTINILRHTHWEVINWPNVRENDFSTWLARRVDFILLLKRINQWLPLGDGWLLGRILTSRWIRLLVARLHMGRHGMFTHRYTIFWHSFAYKWWMKTNILLILTHKTMDRWMFNETK